MRRLINNTGSNKLIKTQSIKALNGSKNESPDRPL